MRKRSLLVTFRLNEREYQHLKAQVTISGLSKEQFLRSLIMGTEIKPHPPGELPQILKQLSAIGNNINQIAKVANTYGRVHQEDIDYIINMQAQIWSTIKRL